MEVMVDYHSLQGFQKLPWEKLQMTGTERERSTSQVDERVTQEPEPQLRQTEVALLTSVPEVFLQPFYSHIFSLNT